MTREQLTRALQSGGGTSNAARQTYVNGLMLQALLQHEIDKLADSLEDPHSQEFLESAQPHSPEAPPPTVYGQVLTGFLGFAIGAFVGAVAMGFAIGAFVGAVAIGYL